MDAIKLELIWVRDNDLILPKLTEGCTLLHAETNPDQNNNQAIYRNSQTEYSGALCWCVCESSTFFIFCLTQAHVRRFEIWSTHGSYVCGSRNCR
jgi:hypothetical protein